MTHDGAAGRRGFLARAGAMLGGLALFGQPASAQARGNDGPLVHPEDAWMDALPRGHRMVFDAPTLSAAAHAGLFAGNFIWSNENGYKLKADQIGVIIVLRHYATAFAFNDAVWAKYGKPISERMKITDPATGESWAKSPFYNPGTFDGPTMGVQWKSLVDKGVHFAVCAAATGNLANIIARATNGKTEDVRQELLAAQMANAHQMATGILAFGRAQEKGFAAVSAF